MRQVSPLWIVLALWAAGLGAAAQFGKASLSFDLLAPAWPGAGPTALGLFVSIVGVPGLILGTTAGIFVQAAGYRRVLVGALAMGAVLSALQALVPPLAVMLVLRVIEGLSHLAVVVAAPVLIAQVTPVARQGLAMSLWSSFFGVTYTLLAIFGRPLAEAAGPGALFLAHAGYMAVLALVLWQVLPRGIGGAAEALPRWGAVLRQHRRIYASARVAAPAFGFFCYTITYVAVLTLLPPFLGGALQVQLALWMPLVSIIVSLTLGVWLLGRLAAVRVVMLGFFWAAGMALGLWFVWGQAIWVLGLSLGLAGALGLVQGASFAAIPQLNAAPGDRAQAAGAVAQLGNLGTTTGTPLLALILADQGAAGLVGFVIGFALLGIALHLWQGWRRGQTRST